MSKMNQFLRSSKSSQNICRHIDHISPSPPPTLLHLLQFLPLHCSRFSCHSCCFRKPIMSRPRHWLWWNESMNLIYFFIWLKTNKLNNQKKQNETKQKCSVVFCCLIQPQWQRPDRDEMSKTDNQISLKTIGATVWTIRQQLSRHNHLSPAVWWTPVPRPLQSEHGELDLHSV